MEPQKPGNSPRAWTRGRAETESPKSERRKESVAGQCRMRLEVSWDECPQALQERFSIMPLLELSSRLYPLQRRRGITSSSVEIEETCVSKNFDETVRLQSEKRVNRRDKRRETARGCRGYE